MAVTAHFPTRAALRARRLYGDNYTHLSNSFDSVPQPATLVVGVQLIQPSRMTHLSSQHYMCIVDEGNRV